MSNFICHQNYIIKKISPKSGTCLFQPSPSRLILPACVEAPLFRKTAEKEKKRRRLRCVTLVEKRKEKKYIFTITLQPKRCRLWILLKKLFTALAAPESPPFAYWTSRSLYRDLTPLNKTIQPVLRTNKLEYDK